jgi:hypothetical protein
VSVEKNQFTHIKDIECIDDDRPEVIIVDGMRLRKMHEKCRERYHKSLNSRISARHKEEV